MSERDGPVLTSAGGRVGHVGSWAWLQRGHALCTVWDKQGNNLCSQTLLKLIVVMVGVPFLAVLASGWETSGDFCCMVFFLWAEAATWTKGHACRCSLS